MHMNLAFAYGRRSVLFENQKETVMKLYDKNFPKVRIDDEYEKTLLVWKKRQLKVPEPLKKVGQGERNGLILQKIDGISLMDIFQKKPWLFFTSSSKVASIHKSIHQVKDTNLPTQTEVFSPHIESSKRILENDKEKLLQILNKSYEPVLCHGDFHHGNLMQTKLGEIYILDWMDAFVGAYQLDVALTAVNAVVSTAPNHIPYFYRQAYELTKNILSLDKKYLKSYSITNIQEYLFLAAAIHLTRYEGSDTTTHLKYYERYKSQYIKLL